VVTVERFGGDDGAVSVSYQSRDGTAVAPEDYTPSAGTLHWPDGDDSVRSFEVAISPDPLREGTEVLELLLLGATGNAVLDPVRAIASLQILDSPAPTGEQVRFTSPLVRAVESRGGAFLGLERVGDPSQPLLLHWTTRAGSALPGLDYETASGVVSYGAGEVGTLLLGVALLDDELFEGTESLRLEVSRVDGSVTTLLAEAEVEIVDDDAPTSGGCVPSAQRLCLQDGRFQVEGTWRVASGGSGAAVAAGLTASSGTFWFFSPDNVEVLLKVLDGCAVPGLESFWVFVAATTDVDFTLTVLDTHSGVVQQYRNPLGRAAVPVQDLLTFRTCP
jgi:hypothetical protein